MSENAAIDRLYDAGFKQALLDLPESRIYVCLQEWLDGYNAAQQWALDEPEQVREFLTRHSQRKADKS